MKTAFLAIPVVLVFILLASSQQVIENPEKPLAKNAGRVVALKEVLKILDEGTDQYYFKYPRNLRIAPDDSIFVQDENQILQFDKSGKFVRNYFKKGQGPGEMTYAGDVFFTDKNIVIQNSSPVKILLFDYSGAYLREFPVRQSMRALIRLSHVFNNIYYFNGYGFPQVKGEPQFVDVLQAMTAIADGTDEVKTLMSFPVKKYVISSGGGGALFDIGKFMAVQYQQKYLLISHTPEYLIKIYDPENDKVVRTFRREYERVKSPPETDESKKGAAIINGKRYTAPSQKYVNDVVSIFTHKNEIWIATSTDVKDKGILIDVFNFDGVYFDNFYLKGPEKSKILFTRTDAAVISGDYLYSIEKNEDETCAIKKYKIGGS